MIFLEIKNDLQRVIVDAFSLFTSDNINSIPITDLGKVIRYLGMYMVYYVRKLMGYKYTYNTYYL